MARGRSHAVSRRSMEALRKIHEAQAERAEKRGRPAKSFRNTGQSWSSEDVRELKRLSQDNTPTRVIGLKLGRTEASVRGKAASEGISLKPTNQRPYNRRKVA